MIRKCHTNTNTCPVCMGFPGQLPVVNREAINKGIRAGLALGCQLLRHLFLIERITSIQIVQRAANYTTISSNCLRGAVESKHLKVVNHAPSYALGGRR